MTGYQVTFFTQQDRKHGHQPLCEWLVEHANSLGVSGATSTLGFEGVGRGGKIRSAKFFEFSDQPVEVTMVVTEAQNKLLFGALQTEVSELFYVKTPVEFGSVGTASRVK